MGRENTIPILRRSLVTSSFGSRRFSSLKQDAAFHFFDVRQVIQTVDRAQEGGFTAPGRAKENIDGVFLDPQVDSAQAFRSIRVRNAEISIWMISIRVTTAAWRVRASE